VSVDEDPVPEPPIVAEQPEATRPAAEAEPARPKAALPGTGKPGRSQQWTEALIIAAIQRWAAEHGKPPVSTEWQKRGDHHPVAQTVAARFGSWTAGLRAAGFEPARSGWTREKILDNLRAFAAEHGHPPSRQEAMTRGLIPGVGQTLRMFGSWASCVEEAGFARPGRGTTPGTRTGPRAPYKKRLATVEDHAPEAPEELRALAGLIDGIDQALPVYFPTEPPAHARKLMESLGVEIRIDPGAVEGRLPHEAQAGRPVTVAGSLLDLITAARVFLDALEQQTIRRQQAKGTGRA
jgi:hypothetical protein